MFLLNNEQVEFDFMGRIFPQMEQACAYFPSATCIRRNYHELPPVKIDSDVCDVPPQRMCTRARHGGRHAQNQVCPSVYALNEYEAIY